MFSPLVVWSVCFVVGIVVGSILTIPLVMLFILIVGLLVFSLCFIKVAKISRVLICILVVFLGVLVFASSQILPSDSINHLRLSEKQFVKMHGLVVSDPVSLNGKTTFAFKVAQIVKAEDSFILSGKIFVRVPAELDAAYGDELFLTGVFFQAKGVYGYIAKSQGCHFILNVKPLGVEIISRGQGHFLKSFALSIKNKMRCLLNAFMPSFSGGIFEALLLGDKGRVPFFLKESMVKNGTWHILVVSGSHTALVAFILLMFLKFICIPRKLRFILTIIFSIIYCIMTGSTAPVVRSTIMTIAVLLSFLIERNPLFYQSLCLAGVSILLFDPTQLFQAGFQLSFASVFFIVMLFPRIKKIFPDKWFKNRFLEFILNSFGVSFAAWLGTWPLIAYTFKSFSIVTVVANMAIVPLSMLITTAGFTFLIIAGLCPFLAHLTAQASDFLIYILVKMSLFFSNLSWASLLVPTFPLFLVFVYYLFIFYIIFILPEQAS